MRWGMGKFLWAFRALAFMSAALLAWCAKLSIEAQGVESFFWGGLAFINLLSLGADIKRIEGCHRAIREGIK